MKDKKMSEKFSLLEYTIEFSKRLCNERQRVNLSVVDFCEKMDVSRASQHLYEKGTRLPFLEYILKTTELGFDILYLIIGVNKMISSFNDYDEKLLIKAFELTDELTISEKGTFLDKEYRKKMFLLIYRALMEADLEKIDDNGFLQQFKKVDIL